jgi:hypothetical protein
MATVKDPNIKINGKVVTIVSGSFAHTKGVAKRNTNIDSGGNIHITEDTSTAKSTIKFELYSKSESEILFNEWIANGNNNVISFIRGSLTSNGSEMTIVNTDVEIKYGTDETFEIMFEGKPIVE